MTAAHLDSGFPPIDAAFDMKTIKKLIVLAAFSFAAVSGLTTNSFARTPEIENEGSDFARTPDVENDGNDFARAPDIENED